MGLLGDGLVYDNDQKQKVGFLFNNNKVFHAKKEVKTT